MRTGSLFSGYCGLDKAAHAVFGGALAWVSDNHPSAVKLLTHRFPEVPNLGDITAIDWTQVEPVDLITAGFPCQDISNAGQRAGIEGARSGLWSHVADAVRVLRPRHVVLENVSALLVRGLDRVVADLAEIGYDLRWTCVRASDVGAPHRRERWFGYATPRHAEVRGRDVQPSAGRSGEPAGPAGRSGVAAAHTDGEGPQRTEPARRHELPARRSDVDWGQFGPAIRRWELLLGRAAPAPTQPGRVGGQVLSPRFVEWMQGADAGWVTDVPDLSRSDMLRLLGNGVVSQQGEAALRWLAAQELREAA